MATQEDHTERKHGKEKTSLLGRVKSSRSFVTITTSESPHSHRSFSALSRNSSFRSISDVSENGYQVGYGDDIEPKNDVKVRNLADLSLSKLSIQRIKAEDKKSKRPIKRSRSRSSKESLASVPSCNSSDSDQNPIRKKRRDEKEQKRAENNIDPVSSVLSLSDLKSSKVNSAPN